MFDRAREQALGATLRCGRHITGNVEPFRDLLEAAGGPSQQQAMLPSILVLGPPGTGKVSAVRRLIRGRFRHPHQSVGMSSLSNTANTTHSLTTTITIRRPSNTANPIYPLTTTPTITRRPLSASWRASSPSTSASRRSSSTRATRSPGTGASPTPPSGARGG